MCDCIKTLDEGLAPRNARLTIPLIGPKRVLVMVERMDTARGKPKAPYLFATFCPFCGEKYDQEEADAG